MFVYMILNQENGKIYIGKTITSDLKKYLRDKLSSARTERYEGRSHLFAAMRKYPPYVWAIFPLISSLKSDKEICFWERVLVAEYDSQNPSIGYNLRPGGEGTAYVNKGWKPSPETIAKMKAAPKTDLQLANLELARLPETIAKVRVTKLLRGQTEKQKETWKKVMVKGHHGLPKGFHHSGESRTKMSRAKKGRIPWNKGKIGVQKRSEETKRKISATMKERGIVPKNRTPVLGRPAC